MNELFVKGKIIGLPEMLDGREARIFVQREILKQCNESGGDGLVCFTLNAPGPIKVNFLMDVAFYTGVEVIAQELGKLQSSEQANDGELHYTPARSFILEHEYGHEAYFPIKKNIIEVKKLLTQIEENHPLGRLFDIDVIRPDGCKVSRTEIGFNERRCLICGGLVSKCAPNRTHTVSELQKKTWNTIYEYIRKISRQDVATKARGDDVATKAHSEDVATKAHSEDVAYKVGCDGVVISRLAHMAMSLEVATTPKPGLVDLENNGSHSDMDAETFARSANAINSYFGKCWCEGKNAVSANEKNAEEKTSLEGDELAEKILSAIRPLGIKAEEDMKDATGGVNTHAGLIFSLGIICAAIGCQAREEHAFDIDEILNKAAMIAKPTLSEKASGARLEAAESFPLLKNVALPSLKKALEKNVDINAAGVWTLLKIIAAADDTNMLRRGGNDAADWAKKRASEVAKEFETALDNDYPPEMMKACYDLFLNKVKKLDEEFIEKNLSPGGAADILAIAYFMTFAREIL